MKTPQFFFSVLVAAFLGATTMVNAQATQAINGITSGSYLGTSNNLDVVFKRQAVAAGLISTTKTSFGLNSVAMPNSVSFGVNAGQFSSGTGSNTYIGQNAGKGQSTSILNSGTFNTFIGLNAGMNNTTGGNNFFGGSNSGWGCTTGSDNVFVGTDAGNSLVAGSGNVFIGRGAGASDNDGNNNTFIGSSSGGESNGSGNVFIGSNSGHGYSTNNVLAVDNSENYNPLIWGDFTADQLKFNGKVGIGGNSTTGFPNFPTVAGSIDVTGYNLFVTGGILTEEVRVNARNSTTGQWADYVFNKDYNLKPLSEVEKYIKDNGHLPNVPSAAQVKEDGIELGNMAKIQQEKIEELTLYIIELNKKLEAQEKRLNELEKKNK